MTDDRSRPALGQLALLTASRLVVNTSARFVYPFLPAIARGLGISLEQAGLLLSARWAVGLGTPAYIAALGRGERLRRLMTAGLALFSLGAAVTSASSVFAGALAGFILLGVAKPVYDVAAQAYVADRSPYHRRARYLSILELTWAGGLLVGAPATGWLIDRLGWRAPFWTLAILSALALLAVRAVIDPDSGVREGTRGRLRLDRSGTVLLGVFGLFSLGGEVMFVVFGAWLEDAFAISLIGLGWLAMVIGLSELTGEGATAVLTDRLGKRRAVAIGLATSIGGFGSLALLNQSLGWGLAMVAFALLGFEFTIVSAIPLASEVAPTARSRYLAMTVLAMSLARAAGAALGPWLFTTWGVAANAVTAATANLAALTLLLLLVREDT